MDTSRALPTYLCCVMYHKFFSGVRKRSTNRFSFPLHPKRTGGTILWPDRANVGLAGYTISTHDAKPSSLDRSSGPCRIEQDSTCSGLPTALLTPKAADVPEKGA